MDMIEIENVHKKFGDLHVLKGVDIHVGKGQAVVLIGASGSGKTTICRCINFLEEYDSGEIRIDGELMGYRYDSNNKLIKRSPAEIAKSRAEVGMDFQIFNLFPHMNVLKNVTAGPINVKKIKKNEAENIATEILEKVGLIDKINEYPAKLSGGQQQRVGIARALAMEPKIMLFDEVTSALDPELVGEVLSVMRALKKDGMTMVIVTHEMHFAKDVADRIYFLDGGKVAEQGEGGQIIVNPQTDRLKTFLRRYTEEYFL